MTDLQTLANIGEIVGAITVILSLIYLATQIRQNTQAQRSENYSRALDRLAAMQATMAQNDEFGLMFSKGAVDTEQLTPRERIRFTWRCYETFGVFEFMFHASKTDALPKEVWDRWSKSMAWWLSYPGVQAWWAAKPTPFTDSFTSCVDSLLADHPTDAESNRRYEQFLAEGKTPDQDAGS
jgi:hypothetical protein